MRRYEDIVRLAQLEARWWSAIDAKIRAKGDPTALRVNLGLDIESQALLGFTGGYSSTATTNPTATTFTTDSVNIPLNSVAGQYIITTGGAIRFGIIQSNTSAASSVLTIDRWYDATALPANAGTGAASTPSGGSYPWMIPPGQAPGSYMGLSASVTAPAATDTTLASELNNAGGGLNRQLGTYAHSAAGSTTTLTKTYTMNASDTGGPFVIHQMAVFVGVVVAASRMIFRTVLNADATMTTTGDQLQLTHTTTL